MLTSDCATPGDECCDVWANNFPSRGNTKACVPPLRTMVPTNVENIYRGYTIHCTTNQKAGAFRSRWAAGALTLSSSLAVGMVGLGLSLYWNVKMKCNDKKYYNSFYEFLKKNINFILSKKNRK